MFQVDEFELAEETPVKASSSSRTPVTASQDAAEPQARRMKPPASAERRTAEWLSALSPVIEHEEHSPAGQLDSIAAHVVEQGASSPVSQDAETADASPAIEYDGRISVSQVDTRHADASPRQPGMCYLANSLTSAAPCLVKLSTNSVSRQPLLQQSKTLSPTFCFLEALRPHQLLLSHRTSSTAQTITQPILTNPILPTQFVNMIAHGAIQNQCHSYEERTRVESHPTSALLDCSGGCPNSTCQCHKCK